MLLRALSLVIDNTSSRRLASHSPTGLLRLWDAQASAQSFILIR